MKGFWLGRVWTLFGRDPNNWALQSSAGQQKKQRSSSKFIVAFNKDAYACTQYAICPYYHVLDFQTTSSNKEVSRCTSVKSLHQQVMILSDQSAFCSVFTSLYGIGWLACNLGWACTKNTTKMTQPTIKNKTKPQKASQTVLNHVKKDHQESHWEHILSLYWNTLSIQMQLHVKLSAVGKAF